MLDFGREVCGSFDVASRREWLATNGLGSYASGTIAGVHTRRYHGLLIAALKPPVARALLIAGLEETAVYDGHTNRLFTHQWGDRRVEPHGYRLIERFYLDGTIPTWVYALADAQLEKRIWMQPGANTTYIHYRLKRTALPVSISLRVLVNPRDHHGETSAGALQVRTQLIEGGVRAVSPGAPELAEAFVLNVLSDRAAFTTRLEPLPAFYMNVEAERGEPELDHVTAIGEFEARLQPGESLTILASTETTPRLDGAKALQERQAYDRQIVLTSGFTDPVLERLALAADQFIVRRAAPNNPNGFSVIAGYPWFTDWGRDTMISLPGLALVTGQPEVARSVLRTFSAYISQGMLPNRFPDAGEQPEYNTVDATLWYLEALRSYFDTTHDDDLLAELFPTLQSIYEWHIKGTRYQIHVDPEDGLVYAGQPGVQLTWMDAKAGDWVVTPRIGKPVEINALWYNALRCLADFASHLGMPGQVYEAAAEKARLGFGRFWNPERSCCFDVIDGPQGNDAALRPNQLFAVSLPHSPLSAEQQRAVVDLCARQLLTSYGLRSLDPADPAYVGRYGGHRRTRDAIYHQGAVWGWLIGPFASAHLRVYNDPQATRSYLEPFVHHLDNHGLGSISEIFDGDPPFTPRGCIAQAWSVAEVLRVYHEINKFRRG
jgi:predicted glycogen debranching enzyme